MVSGKNKAGSLVTEPEAGEGEGPRNVFLKAHHNLGCEENWSFSISLTCVK